MLDGSNRTKVCKTAESQNYTVEQQNLIEKKEEVLLNIKMNLDSYSVSRGNSVHIFDMGIKHLPEGDGDIFTTLWATLY